MFVYIMQPFIINQYYTSVYHTPSCGPHHWRSDVLCALAKRVAIKLENVVGSTNWKRPPTQTRPGYATLDILDADHRTDDKPEETAWHKGFTQDVEQKLL